MLRSKSLISLLAVAAIVVTSACSTSPTGRPQVLIGSKRDLDAQARWAFREVKKEAPLTTHGPTIEYITCVANHVLDQVPQDEFDARDWEMIIADIPETQALVMPGGKMVIYTGILAAARNQHQLAAVLGHEIAHEVANHPLERKTQNDVANYGVAVVGAVAVGNTPSWQTARGTFESLRYAAQLGFMLPFSRAHETEADIVGLRYMAQAGFDPRESIDLWKNMGAQNPDRPPEFLMTHPSDETRMTTLIKELETSLPLYNEARARGADPQCVAPDYLQPALKAAPAEDGLLEPATEEQLDNAEGDS